MTVICVSAGWFRVIGYQRSLICVAANLELICQYANVLYQFVNEAINLSMSQYANVRIQFANVLICQCANDGYLRICRMVSGFPGISVHSGIDANELQQYANVLYQFVNELICQCANDGY